ncbi:hypothetical protein BT93_I0676 [Corymbia citriodora subsp. variegata]|nr:hypothetical protein BT93_I0676 [Corymbia citriodora subsp. variegata]
MDVQHHRRADPDSAEASPRGSEFELSGMRSGGCKENMDIRAKWKSRNTCQFYYVRSKRMRSQHSAPHFTYFLKAKSRMGSEDFVYEQLIRSHNLVHDTKMVIQRRANGLNPGITEAREQNDSIRKDYCISHPGEFPLISVKQPGRSDGHRDFAQDNAHDRSTIREDCADFRDCFVPAITGEPTAHPESNSSQNLSRKTEEILAQELLSASPDDEKSAFYNKLDGLNISSSNHNKIAISGQVNSSQNLSRKTEEILAQELLGASPDDERNLTHGQVHACVATSANDHIDLSNCVLNMACEMDFHDGEEVDESSIHVPGEISVEMMVCSLNREDPHIPWHDDLASSTVLFSSVICQSHKDSKNDASLPANNESKEEISLLKTEENPPNTSINYHSVEQHKLPDEVCNPPNTSINYQSVEQEDKLPDEGSNKLPASWGVQTVFPNIASAIEVTREEIDAPAETSPSYREPEDQNFTERSLMGESLKECNFPNTSMNYQPLEQHKLPDEGSNKLPARWGVKTVFPNIASAIAVNKEEINAPAETSPSYREPQYQNFTERSLMSKSLKECNPTGDLSDGECSSLSFFHELDSSLSRLDVEEYESDCDDSKLTDIWEMIHGMDLYPGDRDSHVNGEVFRYRHEYKRESAIRLEQCAGSFIQQAIASGGPLAILYGQNSKHYIRKDEVVLGRETEDFQVDIDLGRGGTNKISRRQALIKLERDGTFILKNLGKSLIYVNGTAVPGGNHIHLTTNCLIEVKGMKLSFGINERSVRHHLAKLAKESRGANRNFEWSPEISPSNAA